MAKSSPNSESGMIFDIKEFAVHDGPGIRTTVFLKGCPLSCTWCHNPEGQSSEPQRVAGPTGGRISGRRYSADEVAFLLNDHSELLRPDGGGVTFSGGEPLSQARFLVAIIDKLKDMHVLVDTSGFASESVFQDVVARANLVHFDLKIMDNEKHLRYTGVENTTIHNNLKRLATMSIPYIIRVPLVPGVSDTHENLTAIADAVAGLSGLLRVELLPYNRAAGGKYRSCGMEFRPGYDEDDPLNCDSRPFIEAGVEVKIT